MEYKEFTKLTGADVIVALRKMLTGEIKSTPKDKGDFFDMMREAVVKMDNMKIRR